MRMLALEYSDTKTVTTSQWRQQQLAAPQSCKVRFDSSDRLLIIGFQQYCLSKLQKSGRLSDSF